MPKKRKVSVSVSAVRKRLRGMAEIDSNASAALFEHLQKESFLLPASPLSGLASDLYEKEGKFVPNIGAYKFYEHSGIINRLDHFYLRGLGSGFDHVMKMLPTDGLIGLFEQCDEANKIISLFLNDILVYMLEKNESVDSLDWIRIKRVVANIEERGRRLKDTVDAEQWQHVRELLESLETVIAILLRIVFSLHTKCSPCTVEGTLSETIQDRIRMVLSYKKHAKSCGVPYMDIPIYTSCFRNMHVKIDINWKSISDNNTELLDQINTVFPLDRNKQANVLTKLIQRVGIEAKPFEEVMHEVDRMQTFSMVHAMAHCIRSQKVDESDKSLLMREYKKVFTDQALRSCCCCGEQVYSKKDSLVHIECMFQDIHSNQYIKVFKNTQVAASHNLQTFNCFLEILKISDEDKNKYLHEVAQFDAIRREYEADTQITDLQNLTRRSPRSVLCVKSRRRKDQYDYYHLHPELIYKKGCTVTGYEWHEGMDSGNGDSNGFGHDCASGVLYDDEHVAMEMCKICWNSLARKTKPKFSLCHLDFGCLDRLCLPRLSLIEQLVTSRARQFGIIVQLHFGSRLPSVLRSQLICFKLDGPEKVVCLFVSVLHGH